MIKDIRYKGHLAFLLPSSGYYVICPKGLRSLPNMNTSPTACAPQMAGACPPQSPLHHDRKCLTLYYSQCTHLKCYALLIFSNLL